MIVFGDHSRLLDVRQEIEFLKRDLKKVSSATKEFELQRRREWLIDLAELCQGLLDWNFKTCGVDQLDEGTWICSNLLHRAGHWFAEGLQEEPHSKPSLQDLFILFDGIQDLDLPTYLPVRSVEGFTYYSVYPDAYYLAARECQITTPGNWVVLGLRSAGVALAAATSAGLATVLPPLTLRPVSHPFDRKLAVSPELEELIVGDSKDQRMYAIVDEGPGLSGSSFNCVADWLEARGVLGQRIFFFPSHPGNLGPKASESHLRRWSQAKKYWISFEKLIDSCSDLRFLKNSRFTGGGHWRVEHFADHNPMPPSHLTLEQRKHLLQNGSGQTIHARFIGFGKLAKLKLMLADALSREGRVPAFQGGSNGFLLERWRDDLKPCYGPFLRKPEDLVNQLAEYIGSRLQFSVETQEAVDLRKAQTIEPYSACLKLLKMVQFNLISSGAFAPNEVREECDGWVQSLPSLALRIQAVLIDGKMQKWEWLAESSGRLLKCDYVDHFQGHDCVGLQDIYWDIAGAAVEWELSLEQRRSLENTLMQRNPSYTQDEEKFQFYWLCYHAFQLGYFSMAADTMSSLDSREAQRFREHAGRYVNSLRMTHFSRQGRHDLHSRVA